MVGEAKAICNENGQWSSVPPVCKATQCEAFDLGAGSKVAVTFSPAQKSGTSSFPAEATASCGGMKLKGAPRWKCTESGKWVAISGDKRENINDLRCVDACGELDAKLYPRAKDWLSGADVSSCVLDATTQRKCTITRCTAAYKRGSSGASSLFCHDVNGV